MSFISPHPLSGDEAVVSEPLFQIVPEKTLGLVLKALLLVSMASACSAGPGALSLAGEASGIEELDTDRQTQTGREGEFRTSWPQGTGGQSCGHSAFWGVTRRSHWRRRLLSGPGRTLVALVHLGCRLDAAVSAWPESPEQGEGQTDTSSLGARQGVAAAVTVLPPVPFHPSLLWHPCGVFGPFVHESHGLPSAAPGCCPAQPRALAGFPRRPHVSSNCRGGSKGFPARSS